MSMDSPTHFFFHCEIYFKTLGCYDVKQHLFNFFCTERCFCFKVVCFLMTLFLEEYCVVQVLMIFRIAV